ncbi:NADH-quinone oxidoreductase subunit J family protein [Caldithrix abyssi]|uniref:NADH-quinone oxidoreductase subunit J n=1 Tax=Caldithrix abyssi DSM 13497 TaxID=880073 RepID=H1XQ45_CALAY|nr:NADH-quinone oxidoreductase subunit J [Caldithrix abyssi]APF18274.1 NADH dehydrogenase subunit J [Caldithrix abyssi DSM 13497]EHO42296.1 NADH-ubiquinone/plastoquinone oxidoreductase chain 6 [Caldithrix abyssi DSM 13497]
MEMQEILFYAIVAFTLFSAAIVAFANKIIYSAFALLFTFIGFAGLYIYLSADFLAVTQIIIYVGGILILILFGVLLTQNIYDLKALTSHNSFIFSLAGGLFVLIIIGFVLSKTPWIRIIDKAFEPTTAIIGTAILTDYLLPFEIASVLLLGALIGAVYLARAEGKKK